MLLNLESDTEWTFEHTVKHGYNEQLKNSFFVRYNRVNLCTKITNLT